MSNKVDFGRYLQSVAERDIDLLLMEEFHLDDRFVASVAGLVGLGPKVAFDGAWHSLNDENGETDLLLRVRCGRERIGILIENKISAPEQRAQDARYYLRGQRSCDEGRIDRFVTAICAPQVYLDGLPGNSSYEHRIPYEFVRDWFAQSKGKRSQWRKSIMDEAIGQGRRGYTMKVHSGKTAFHAAYWLLIQERYSDFIMARPGPKGPKSDWIRFKAHGFPKGVSLNHKADQRCMDLEFSNTTVQDLSALRASNWPTGVRIVARQKSAALSLPVPAVDMAKLLAEQIEAVDAALKAAALLAPLATIREENL